MNVKVASFWRTLKVCGVEQKSESIRAVGRHCIGTACQSVHVLGNISDWIRSYSGHPWDATEQSWDDKDTSLVYLSTYLLFWLLLVLAYFLVFQGI